MGSEGIVQQLLDENRKLKVDVARYRMEIDEAKLRVGKPDPRLHTLEVEVQRLREDLAEARRERDALRAGILSALSRLKRG